MHAMCICYPVSCVCLCCVTAGVILGCGIYLFRFVLMMSVLCLVQFLPEQARCDFERKASIYYGHLNEAGYLREIAPLLTVSVLLDTQTQHVDALNQVFGETLATYLTAAQSGLRQ